MKKTTTKEKIRNRTKKILKKKEGVYTYSCWMGMITGKIYVEK